MSQPFPNSYLQRYELKHGSREGHSLNKSTAKSSFPAQLTNENHSPSLSPAHSIAEVVSKLQERVDGIDVKMTSLINVVKLLQKYTSTRDDQYEKQKENQMLKKAGEGAYAGNCMQIDAKVRQFDALSKQFRDELKALEKLKGSFVLPQFRPVVQSKPKSVEEFDIQELQERLREEINKKMEICIRLINAGGAERGISQRVGEISFGLNQLENQIKRNRMVLEKDIERLTALVKDGRSIQGKDSSSTAIPISLSRVAENDLSRSPARGGKSKSKNSKSDKSLSKGRQNQNRSAVMINLPKEASKIRDEELREALRKKRENRERLKVKNW